MTPNKLAQYSRVRVYHPDPIKSRGNPSCINTGLHAVPASVAKRRRFYADNVVKHPMAGCARHVMIKAATQILKSSGSSALTAISVSMPSRLRAVQRHIHMPRTEIPNVDPRLRSASPSGNQPLRPACCTRHTVQATFWPDAPPGGRPAPAQSSGRRALPDAGTPKLRPSSAAGILTLRGKRRTGNPNENC